MSDETPNHYQYSPAQSLTEEQIEVIAERAAVKAVEKLTNGVYQSVGKTVISRLLYFVGAVAIAAWLWLNKQGAA
jgi:hypothetical protein